MNLSAYMQMSVTPLSDYTPERKPKRKVTRNQADTLDSRRNAAIERYRSVMGSEWMQAREIDRRLGRKVGSDRIMKKWIPLGIVERRNYGGADVYDRQQGYQWRMK